MKNPKHDLASICGIYCGACPSYVKKTCFGCRSDDRNQKRTSKWGCNIRKCCHKEKNLEFCFECNDYPCKVLIKLRNSHLNDDRFEYRHKLFYNLVRIKKIGLDEWLEEQEEIWCCPECGGNIVFYENKCFKCGKISNNVLKNYAIDDD